jgi:hypothetical protein
MSTLCPSPSVDDEASGGGVSLIRRNLSFGASAVLLPKEDVLLLERPNRRCRRERGGGVSMLAKEESGT